MINQEIVSIDSIHPIIINGEGYWTIKQFALLTEKSEVTIRKLLCYGNKLRKIKSVTIESKPFIPYLELFEYRFVESGRCNSLGMYTSYGFMLNEDGDLDKINHQEYPAPTKNEDVEEEIETFDEEESNDILDDEGNREQDVFEINDDELLDEE